MCCGRDFHFVKKGRSEEEKELQNALSKKLICAGVEEELKIKRKVTLDVIAKKNRGRQLQQLEPLKRGKISKFCVETLIDLDLLFDTGTH
jgi:hypothetical protein